MEKMLYAPLLDPEELAALMNSQPMRYCPKVEERISQEAEDILKGERLHFSEENNIPDVSLQCFFRIISSRSIHMPTISTKGPARINRRPWISL